MCNDVAGEVGCPMFSPRYQHLLVVVEALRVRPTIDQDVILECTQRKEREWWEGDKHIAVMSICSKG